MKPISIFSVLVLALSLTACQRHSASPTPPPLTGTDRDAHGCIGSAGYTWSPARKECVRVFDAGLAFDPTAYNPDQTTRAYVLTDKSMGRQVSSVELFWPGEDLPWVLDAVPTRKDDVRPLVLESKPHQVKIYRTSEEAYMLERDGKVLFIFGPKEGNPLNTIGRAK